MLCIGPSSSNWKVIPSPADVGKWTSEGCASPRTMWEPYEACSWRVGPFWGLTDIQFLQTQYWWWGMQLQVQQFVSKCMVCDQVQASFNAPTPHLQPLPIMGLGYQWSLDFFGPLSLTPWHNQYVLVMIEHFSKWLELVLLLNCNSERATYAFLNRIFNRFGVLIEVLINQGIHFYGEFQ